MWYIKLYPLYPRFCLTQAHFASQAFHKSGVPAARQRRDQDLGAVAMGSVGVDGESNQVYGVTRATTGVPSGKLT